MSAPRPKVSTAISLSESRAAINSAAWTWKADDPGVPAFADSWLTVASNSRIVEVEEAAREARDGGNVLPFCT